jgi:hypothetical protein
VHPLRTLFGVHPGSQILPQITSLFYQARSYLRQFPPGPAPGEVEVSS